MYIPTPFRCDDALLVRQCVEQHSFATLVVPGDSNLEISHVPLLVEFEADRPNVVTGHIAASNPAAAGLRAGGRVWAVFSGPHTYISPTYYTSRKNVPTWNYVAVHISGRPTVIEDPVEALRLLRRQSEKYEAMNGTDWDLDDLGAGAERMLSAIVAFRICDLTVEAKFKLGQNRSEADWLRLRESLRSAGDSDRMAIAALMDRIRPMH